MAERDRPLRHICIRLRERSERRGHPDTEKLQKFLLGSESRLSVLDPEIVKSQDYCPDQTELLARAVADAHSHYGCAVRLLAPARLLAPIVRSIHNGGQPLRLRRAAVHRYEWSYSPPDYAAYPLRLITQHILSA